MMPTRVARRLPPVILLGGDSNALSIARSLGRLGVRVYALHEAEAPVVRSRYCTWLGPRRQANGPAAWARFLLGPAAAPLHGAVLLACSDDEVEFLARQRTRLAAKFRLDLSHPPAQLCMLDKLCTYRQAQAAGVPLPRFWAPQTLAELEHLRGELVFPLLVKPLSSQAYRRRFGRKLAPAQDFSQARQAFAEALAAGIPVLLLECIPGPDDRLCSYYTYLDEEGKPLFHYTKRIIRRYPPLRGPACCHVTDSVPEIVAPALRLFQAVGLRGLANAEFKWDERDRTLKLIECNARFTEGNCLVLASGFDLARFVYARLVGLPVPELRTYRRGLRLWYPLEDVRAFRQLRREGQLTWRGWLRTLRPPLVLPYFSWEDPWPSWFRLWQYCREALGRRLAHLGRWLLSRLHLSPPATAPAAAPSSPVP
jgi:D-aspartate ligase